MLTIGETLAFNARNAPDREALVFGARRLTWRALDEGANRIANALLGLGLAPGDRVLLLLGNRVELVELIYGLARIGCIAAPALPRSTAAEIAYMADDLGARLIVAEAAPGPAAAGEVIGVGEGHGCALDYHRLRDAASPAPPEIAVDADADFTIKYTSGTTGEPKGCLRTQRQFLMAALANLMQVPHLDGDRAAISSPLAAGLALSLLTMYVARGVPVVLLPRFEATALLETIARERITLAYAIESTLPLFCEHPDFDRFDLSSLRLFSAGGAQTTRARLLRIRDQPSFRGGFYGGYGSSEAGGRVAYTLPEDYARALSEPALAERVSSVGREAPLCRVACLDDDLRPVPQGEIGEMAVKAPWVFKGYWGRPAETAAVFRDGWLMTGDLIRMDAEGFIYLAGRKRDMIKTGGINIYPAEIEPVLAAHPAVREAAVVGVPDETWGEMAVACVVAERPVSERALLDHCRTRLAGHKCPKAVRFFERMPTNETGKVVKKDLREMLIAERAGDTR